jgi:hypothetical protein
MLNFKFRFTFMFVFIFLLVFPRPVILDRLHRRINCFDLSVVFRSDSAGFPELPSVNASVRRQYNSRA